MANSNSSELVDVHAHFLTEEYVSAAVSAGIVQPDGMPMWPSWSIEAQLELMQHNRIRHAVLSMSTPGVSFADPSDASALARHVNDFAVTTVAAHPGRFSFFASLPLPDVDAAVVEAQRAIDRHAAAGVVLLSNHRGQYLGDAALDPLWVYLNARQSIVFVHPTSPPHAETVALGRPPAHDRVHVRNHPHRNRFDLRERGRPVPRHQVLDPALRGGRPSASGGAYRAVPQPVADARRRATRTPDDRNPVAPLMVRPRRVSDAHPGVSRVGCVGTERILYGSDFCWTPAFGVAKQVAALDADRSIDWRRVTSENAQRVLGDILAV